MIGEQDARVSLKHLTALFFKAAKTMQRFLKNKKI
jgi:hypothetical protein